MPNQPINKSKETKKGINSNAPVLKEDITSEKPVLRPVSVLTPIAKSEVNFLKLPYFALSEKDMLTRTRTTLRVITERDGRKGNAIWTVSSNPEYGYPGPFDKKVYKAIEQLITEIGIPIKNPIVFSLRDLCRKIGIKGAGRDIRRIKQSLRRMVATVISTDGIYYQKALRETLSDTFHLYDSVKLVDRTKKAKSENKKAEVNLLYLSKPYLENINALYFQYTDYEYWRSLTSPIASRLYELLNVQFRAIKQKENKWFPYTITYPALCIRLPIVQQTSLSLARKNLDPGHQQLLDTKFLSKVIWQTARGNQRWKISYYPGNRAKDISSPHALALRQSLFGNELNNTIEVLEETLPIVDVDETEWIEKGFQPHERSTQPLTKSATELVCYFQEKKNKRVAYEPNKAELRQACDLVKLCDQDIDKARYVVNEAIRQMKKTKFEAQWFGAVMRYKTDGLASYEKYLYEKEMAERERAEREEQERQKKAEDEAYLKVLKAKSEYVEEAKLKMGEEEFKEIEQESIKRLPKTYQEQIEDMKKKGSDEQESAMDTMAKIALEQEINNVIFERGN